MKKKGNVLIGIGVVVILLTIVFGGVYFKTTGHSINGENYLNDPFVTKVSRLSDMGLDSVESFDEYKNFADRINSLIIVINENANLGIPLFKKTNDAWIKLSNSINRYTPLIDNYNNLIYSAKTHENIHTNETYETFYRNSRSFSIELIILSSTIAHQATFTVVGKVFGNLGIGGLALNCPICAKTAMSTAYWSLKSYLAEGSSELLEGVFNSLENKFGFKIK